MASSCFTMRLEIAALFLLLVTGSGCRRIPEERARELEHVPIRTKVQLVALYHTLSSKPNYVAQMAVFCLRMQEAGPRVAPMIIDAMAKEEVGVQTGCNALRHIDMKHRTSWLAHALLDERFSSTRHALAVCAVSSSHSGPKVAGNVWRVASDAIRPSKERQRAGLVVMELLLNMAGDPALSTEEQEWAKKLMVRVLTATTPPDCEDVHRP